MRVGLSLPQYDFSYPDSFADGVARRRADLAATVQWARRAEALGYDSLWVSDHFFLDSARYGGPAGHIGSLEPIVTLAAVASATTRVRLGTLVLSEAFRAPATLAKQATVLDVLSNGRLDLGIGAGWYEDEYKAAGFEFPRTGERITRMRETLQILDAMLSQETSSFAGKHYSITEMLNAPQPVQKPRPPLWVGGKGGERMARIIARYADGWNTVWKWTVEAYEAPARVLDAACAETGRTVKRSVGLFTIVSDDVSSVFEQWRTWGPTGMLSTLDAFREGALIGTAVECAETIKRFAALGVEEIIVAPGPLPFAIPIADQVESIATDLIPLVRDV